MKIPLLFLALYGFFLTLPFLFAPVLSERQLTHRIKRKASIMIEIGHAPAAQGEIGGIKYRLLGSNHLILETSDERRFLEAGDFANDNLFLKNRYGVKIWSGLVGFLRHIVLSEREFVYANNEAVMGIWHPGAEGISTLSFLRNSWKVYARSTRNGRLLWKGNYIDTGVPVALTDSSTLWTIRLGNPRGYFALGHASAFFLDKRNGLTGAIILETPIIQMEASYFRRAEDFAAAKISHNDNIWKIILGHPTDDYWSIPLSPGAGLIVTCSD